ncbi:MAG TPA: hypothetical protein VGJ86_00680 [Acidimicrobiales bacterium]|jgi:hypothetical protein
MAEPITDEGFVALLTSVGEHLVVPEVGDLWADRRHRDRRATTRFAVAVAAAVTVATVVLAPAREAVASWFGLGVVRFEVVSDEEGDPTGLPPLDAGVAPASRAEARQALGRPLPVVGDPALGLPDRIGLPPDGGVLLSWDEGATSLWLIPTRNPAVTRMRKLLDNEDGVTELSDLGESAVAIEGNHILTTPARRVAAGTVVLWIDDGLELRLESDLGLPTMLSIARSVH